MSERATRLERNSRQALVGLGLRTPDDLAAWAGERALIAVHLVYHPRRQFLPACWQVVRPGHQTDPAGPTWQHGHKTFIVRSVQEKHACEELARLWAGARFAIRDWARVEGFGGRVLFPLPVVEELAREVPRLGYRTGKSRSL